MNLTADSLTYLLAAASAIALISAVVFALRANRSRHGLAELQASHRELELAQNRLQIQYDNQTQTVTQLQDRLTDESDKLRAASDAHNSAARLNQGLEAELKASRARQQELQDSLARLETRFETLNQSYTALTAENAELRTSQSEQQKAFEVQREKLSEQFKVLANEIFDAKTKSLHESSKESLGTIIKPFREQIDAFKKEVHEIHHRETKQQGELRQELQQLKELNQQITTEAHELSTALRGQKKLQGNWGELVLENVLDRSGLRLGEDYKREVSITTEAGRQRPDVVVYLPQDKHLIIDAKVSLNAYTQFVNAEDELQRSQALKEHVTAMSSRINELADRDYYKLPGLNSPEIVFMFVPIESAFVEALKADETLFSRAIENNVLVATPTTLLTSLNIVRQLWRFEDQNKHTVALAQRAEGVFRKLNSFLGSFEDIKKSLDRAAEAYGKAEGQLVSGKGNLVKQVADFKELAPRIKGELPAYYTDKASLEIDYIPAAEDESDGDGSPG